MHTDQVRNGTVMILTAATGFGLCPLFARVLFESGFGAEATSLYRFGIPLLLILPLFRVRHWEVLESLRMLGLGFANGIGFLLYFQSLEKIPVSTAVLIYYTYPLFSVAVGWLFFGRRPCARAILAAGLVIVGAALAIRPEGPSQDQTLTLISCFAAPLSFSLMIQYLAAPRRPMPALQRITLSQIGTLMALIPLAVSSATGPWLPQTLEAFLLLVGLGVITAGLPQYLFTRGAPLAGPDRTCIAGAGEMVVAMVTGALLLGESLSTPEMLAIALMLIALVVPQKQRGIMA